MPGRKPVPVNTGKKRETVGRGKPPKEHQFGPGNPGRPKGARNKLGEAFLNDMLDDWEKHGTAVIETVRAEKPDQYLKVVASILPKEMNVRVSELEELSDDELDRRIRALADALQLETGVSAASGRAKAPQGSQSLN